MPQMNTIEDDASFLGVRENLHTRSAAGRQDKGRSVVLEILSKFGAVTAVGKKLSS